MKQQGVISVTTGVTTLILAWMLLSGPHPILAADRPDDEMISLWVQDALVEDARVSNVGIKVTTEDGIVKLTGKVNNLAAKKYAGLETTKIKGVRGVLNEISVEVPFRYDFDIHQDILQRLLNSAIVKISGVNVDVSKGDVTLYGDIKSPAEDEQAMLLAMETKGVRSVIDKLNLTYSKDRSDNDILRDVRSDLARDIYLTGLPISATVNSGVVTLNGEVGTAYQKERASSDIRWIWNVARVDNKLDVKWWENEGARKSPPEPTDNQLRRTISEALNQDLRIENPDNIHVDSRGGHVMLRGVVPTFNQKRIAERDAEDTVGTVWVTNYLQVKAGFRSDNAILDDVRFELDTDYALGNMDLIIAKVNDGIVTLAGGVNSFWDKTHAYDVVSGVAGVRGVINNISVNYPPEYTDQAICQRIQDRLASNGETMWVDDDITVSVDDGEVTLSGTVNNWSEFNAAEKVAFNTYGVRAVINNLNVGDNGS